MWCASLVSPTPTSRGEPSSTSARSTSANAAASPIDSPSRSAPNGSAGRDDTSSSERKPYSVVRHSESTPPTTAASMRPAAIIRAALPNTFALDAHAAETANDGPRMPKRRATKSATE